MSLSDCIKKAGKALSETDANFIKSKSQRYINEGLSDAEAAQKAIDDLLKIVDSDAQDVLIKTGMKKRRGKRAKRLRSPFYGRNFLIPDEMVEGFLHNDVEELMHVYLRHTVPDMELVKAFGGKNIPIDDAIGMTQIKKEIMEDYAGMAKEAKTEKERASIIDEGKSVVDAMLGMRDRMRGVYDVPEGAPSIPRRINAAFRNLNYLRLMGGVTASSIPDIGKTVIAEGFMRAFGDGFMPLIKSIGKMKPLKDEVRYYGMAFDTITSGRVDSLADINNYVLGNTKAERGLEYLTNKFGNIALINQWNDAMKTAHAFAMQARVYDDLAAGRYDERLSRLGLKESEAYDIFKMAQKHGEVVNGARLFHPERWENQELAFAWAAALRKESDRVIIVPGQEKPLFMSRDIGKTIMQFRSFMISSTQRTLLAAAQGQEQGLIGGLLTMTTLGAMVYAFKQWDAGRPVSDDPRVWVYEGIERSGALGILMEANSTLEKISGNRFGFRKAVGVDVPSSRFASRNMQEALMGPTYGSALSGILRVTTAGMGEYEWKRSDTTALRRLLPFQNLTFLRQAIDRIEEQTHKAAFE